MFSYKYKEYYTTNFARQKGSCEHIKTFQKTKEKGFHKIYDDISELHYAFKDYKQGSTGQNHTEREIVVVDVDKIIKDPLAYAQYNLPFMPTRISWNKENYHCQFQYFLDAPIRNTSDEWKQLLKFSRKYGDPKYTGWQCKNSFYSDRYIKGKEVTGKKYKVEEFLKYIDSENKYIENKPVISAAFSSSYICVNVPQREGMPIDKNTGSRNVDTFMEGGRWLSNNLGATEDELFNQLILINKRVSEELGKEPSPLCEMRATAKSLIKYKNNNRLRFSFGKEANLISQMIRKNKAAERKINSIILFEKGYNKKEIAKILKVNYKTIIRDLKAA